MTKAPTPTEKSKKQRDNTKNADYTTITDRLRTASWSSNSHAIYEVSTFQLTQQPCYQKDTRLQICK